MDSNANGIDRSRVVKVILVGNTNVGKTSIVERFSSDTFAPSYIPTIGIDFIVQELIVEDAIVVKLHVWDTAGSEKFDSITRNYYHVANAAMAIYDVTDRKSFEAVKRWVGKLQENCNPNTPMMILGNKCDKTDRIVTAAEGEALGEALGLPFLESSAKTNYNIYKAFFKLTKQALKNPPPDASTDLSSDNGDRPKCRC